MVNHFHPVSGTAICAGFGASSGPRQRSRPRVFAGQCTGVTVGAQPYLRQLSRVGILRTPAERRGASRSKDARNPSRTNCPTLAQSTTCRRYRAAAERTRPGIAGHPKGRARRPRPQHVQLESIPNRHRAVFFAHLVNHRRGLVLKYLVLVPHHFSHFAFGPRPCEGVWPSEGLYLSHASSLADRSTNP